MPFHIIKPAQNSNGKPPIDSFFPQQNQGQGFDWSKYQQVPSSSDGIPPHPMEIPEIRAFFEGKGMFDKITGGTVPGKGFDPGKRVEMSNPLADFFGGAADVLNKLNTDTNRNSDLYKQEKAAEDQPITVGQPPAEGQKSGAALGRPWEDLPAPTIDRKKGEWYNPLNYLLQVVNEAGKGINAIGEGGQQIVKGYQESPIFGSVSDAIKAKMEGKPSPINVEQSNKDMGQGWTKLLGGAVGTVASPITGAVEDLPLDQRVGVKALFNMPANAVTDFTKYMAKQVNPSINTETPDFQQNVVQPMQVISQLLMMKHAEKAPELIKGAGEVVKGAADIAGKVTKAGAEKFGGNIAGAGIGAFAGSHFGNPAIGAALGGLLGAERIGSILSNLDTETLKTVFKNPKEISLAQKAGLDSLKADLSGVVKESIGNQDITSVRKSPLQTFKGFIDGIEQSLKENRGEYKNIKESGGKVNLSDKRGNSWFENFITEKKLKIENGEIVADADSAIRSPAELQRLNALYKRYGKYTDFSNTGFLNFRKDIGELAKFGEGITGDMEKFAKEFYAKLNEKGRPQIKGLEEADNATSPLLNSLQNVKDIIYDSEGKLKSNATSLINNLMKKAEKGEGDLEIIRKEMQPEQFAEFVKQIKSANDLENFRGIFFDKSGELKANALKRVNEMFDKPKQNADLLEMFKKQMSPEEFDGLRQKFKIARALEDIEVKSNKVGHILVNAIVGGFSDGAQGAIMGAILGIPKVMVSIFRAAGEAAKKTPEFVDGVISNIVNGIKPKGGQAVFVKNVLSKTFDTLAKDSTRGSAGQMSSEQEKKRKKAPWASTENDIAK